MTHATWHPHLDAPHLLLEHAHVVREHLLVCLGALECVARLRAARRGGGLHRGDALAQRRHLAEQHPLRLAMHHAEATQLLAHVRSDLVADALAVADQRVLIVRAFLLVRVAVALVLHRGRTRRLGEPARARIRRVQHLAALAAVRADVVDHLLQLLAHGLELRRVGAWVAVAVVAGEAALCTLGDLRNLTCRLVRRSAAAAAAARGAGLRPARVLGGLLTRWLASCVVVGVVVERAGRHRGRRARILVLVLTCLVVGPGGGRRMAAKARHHDVRVPLLLRLGVWLCRRGRRLRRWRDPEDHWSRRRRPSAPRRVRPPLAPPSSRWC